MSRTLAEALDDLAEQVGTTGLSGDLASAAWQRGRRRRWRARAARTAAVAAVVVAAAVLALPGSSVQRMPPADGGRGVGYPERIAKPWRLGDLPRNGEPLAGLAFGATEGHGPSDGTWYAVAQDGDLARLPTPPDLLDAAVPAISADGRQVAYVDRDTQRYVIRDVVSGSVTRFPTVGSAQVYGGAAESSPAPYRAEVQSPAYFAPDGRHVAVRALAGAAGAPLLLVLGVDGSLREVPLAEDLNLAGWLGDSELLALEPRASDAEGRPTVDLTPVAVGLTGQIRRLPGLRSDTPVWRSTYTRWSPSLSPDHRTLTLVLGVSRDYPDGQGRTGIELLGFDLESGAQTLDGWSAVGVDTDSPPLYSGTPLEWRADTWALPRLEAEGLRLGPEGDAAPSRALVVTDPRLRLTRLDLADDALSGPAHTSLWGTSVSALSWRGAELLVLGGAAAVALAWWTRRRLRTRGEAG